MASVSQRIAAPGLKTVDDASFQSRVIDAPRPTLVLFTSPACLPCKMMARWLPALGREFAGAIDIVRSPIDASPQAAYRYGVKRTPTLLLFKGGVPLAAHIGLWLLPAIRSWVRETLGCTWVAADDSQQPQPDMRAVGLPWAFLRAFFDRSVVRQACTVASVVAPTLLLINHAQMLLSDPLGIGTLKKLALNFAVPYLVSSYSAARTAAARPTLDGIEVS